MYKDAPVKAKLKILSQTEYTQEANEIDMSEEVIPVQLNPNKITFTDGVNYGSQSKSGPTTDERKIPIGQYTSHKPRELSIELLFDTYTSDLSETEKEDVKEEYIDEFITLITNQDGQPPYVFFSWGSIQFKGVITKLNYTYTMFTREGKPVRATMSLSITEYLYVTQQESS